MVLMVPNDFPSMGAPDPGPISHDPTQFWTFLAIFGLKVVWNVQKLVFQSLVLSSYDPSIQKNDKKNCHKKGEIYDLANVLLN